MVHINDYQKQRFVERMIEAMFNTISGKKIAVLGFAFKKVRTSCLAAMNGRLPPPGSASTCQHDDAASVTVQWRAPASLPKAAGGHEMDVLTSQRRLVQDTGDTRETPAIDVCKGLMADNARINIYDPKVTEAQIHNDLSLDKFMWDHPSASGTKSPRQNSVTCFKDAYSVRLLPASRIATAAQHP